MRGEGGEQFVLHGVGAREAARLPEGRAGRVRRRRLRRLALVVRLREFLHTHTTPLLAE